MKKTLRLLALCMAMILLLVTLTACGPSEEELVGTYSGTYVYNGNTYAVAIILDGNGRYAKASVKNGELNSTEVGDWEVKGSKVILYDDDALTHHGKSTTYKWKNDQLENNDHYFAKQY